MIRQMERENISRVVEIHLASFPGFFLSFLGARFLSLYYSGICAARRGSPTSTSMVRDHLRDL